MLWTTYPVGMGMFGELGGVSRPMESASLDAPNGRSLAAPESRGITAVWKPDALSAAMIGAEAGVAAKEGAGLSFVEQVGELVIEAVDFADPTFVLTMGRMAADAAFDKPSPDNQQT
jgi:hypothetical protein